MNTGAAAVQLKAAGAAGKRQFLLGVSFTNKTANEQPVVEVTEDHAGTPVIKDTIAIPYLIATTGICPTVEKSYEYPIEITAAKTIGFQLQSAVGDVYGHAVVAVED